MEWCFLLSEALWAHVYRVYLKEKWNHASTAQLRDASDFLPMVMAAELNLQINRSTGPDSIHPAIIKPIAGEQQRGHLFLITAPDSLLRSGQAGRSWLVGERNFKRKALASVQNSYRLVGNTSGHALFRLLLDCTTVRGLMTPFYGSFSESIIVCQKKLAPKHIRARRFSSLFHVSSRPGYLLE